jgi:hypothetical protein
MDLEHNGEFAFEKINNAVLKYKWYTYIIRIQ